MREILVERASRPAKPAFEPASVATNAAMNGGMAGLETRSTRKMKKH